MVEGEHRGEPHETQKRIADERRQRAECRGKVQIGLSPTYGVVPDLQNAIALDFADNAVRCRNAVVRSLENSWNAFRNRNGKDEKI